MSTLLGNVIAKHQFNVAKSDGYQISNSPIHVANRKILEPAGYTESRSIHQGDQVNEVWLLDSPGISHSKPDNSDFFFVRKTHKSGNNSRASDWKTLADNKRNSTASFIPEECRLRKIPSPSEQKDITGTFAHQYLSASEIEITETDAVGIAAKVASGSWMAVDVTRAFCHRAAIAHQLLNCLHEVFFDAAIQDACAFDRYYAEHHSTIGPLHGVPVSLKDQFHVKNVETTMGYIGWIDTFEGKKDDPRKGVFESEMVRELRNLGAILYCKTSVPHTLMSGETVNNIIGYTWNPKNRLLSCGGSSGGEGALISFKGAPLDLGTDIGGSIRIPAGFNGLYGLRPTSGRLPYEGMANSMDGQNSVLSVVGPIATKAAGLKLLVRSILSQNPWLYDPLVVDMPWRSFEEEAVVNVVKGLSGQKLSFGVIHTDGQVTPQPPVTRAVAMVVEALTNAGHSIITWDTSSHQHGLDLTYTSWVYDGGQDVHGAFRLSGEPVSAQVAMLYGSDPKEEMSASDIAANNVAKRAWQKQDMDYWNSTASVTGTNRPVDGIIAPLAPFAAARQGMYWYYNYSSFVNGLDYPSVVVPVTHADKNIDVYPAEFKPSTDLDKRIQDECDAVITDGAHVSAQIVGRRYTEEKMLAIAEYVGSLLGK